MTRRVLLTGAAGFIGGHCVRALLEREHAVTGLDSFDSYYARGIKQRTVGELAGFKRFRFVEGDIRDRALVGRLVADCDVVVHLAARVGVRASLDDPGPYASVNVDGTVSVLDACRRAGVRQFVFGSSSSVYGDTTPAPFREDAPALDAISPYAATKRSGELLCRVYSQLHALRVAALRFFTVYGPRQRPDLVIHTFTRLLAEERPIRQYGDGSTERDYTHVDDVVSGVLGALRWVDADDAAFEIFNLGESRAVRLDRLIQMIAGALRVEPRIERVPMQAGDVRRTRADISKARRMLGYAPRVTIEEGIPQFVAWYEETYGRAARTAS